LILEEVVATLENGKHCTLFSSGMAAIAACFSLLKQGDHLLMAGDIYGGTFRLGEQWLPRSGVEVSEFCAHNPLTIADEVQASTKMLIFETPTNPNLRVSDIEAVVTAAKKHGLLTVFDNTFASPALQNPLDLGVDIVLHSTTKYISGHSDVIGGATITNDPELGNWLFEYNKAFGATPSPFDCWLSLRGVKTLACRMDQHSRNAQAVAEFLEGHPKVKRVFYPGLTSHPDHETAKKQMRGFGGMVSFRHRDGLQAALDMVARTQVFTLGESLGGVESLIEHPGRMTHASAAGSPLEVPDDLVRLSVGIESIEDLIDDLATALG
jgi:cystathionine beta-lyase/cystathionine gamma-synthase